MSVKTVEAYSQGRFIAKRTILFEEIDASTSADFIALARESMADDGISPRDLDRWIVRDPVPGE